MKKIMFRCIFILEFDNSYDRNSAVNVLKDYFPIEMLNQKDSITPYIEFDNGSTAQAAAELLKDKLACREHTREKIQGEIFAGEHDEDRNKCEGEMDQRH